ncbi:MAG TPA: hypothetical protein VER37_04955, partial [Thermomicrobiales bacterium]|nr:hypothetical protein [Thermomicrobiales bacterium]
MPTPPNRKTASEQTAGSGYLDRKSRAIGIARSASAGVADREAPHDPPFAERRPSVREFAGIRIEDPYAWLEDPADPATIAYLEAENAYREAVMASTLGLQDRLYAEMLGRIEQTDRSVPVDLDGWRYADRPPEGQQYPALVRSPADGEPEQPLLDLNEMVRTGYIRLHGWRPSPDGRYLAYVLNESGGIEATLYVKDLETGATLADEIPLAAGFAWANNSRTLFYGRQDATLRPAELRRHELGSNPSEDPLLYREDNLVFSLGIDETKDRAFLLLTSWSSESSEVRYLPADDPD